MIRSVAFILSLVFLPSVLPAEVIDVRSGEHAGFSRLVMQFPSAVNWEFGRSDGQYELRTSEGDIAFRTDEIYQKIPRSRIADIEDGTGFLRLTTPQNVHADVFELRAGRIVIDIKDGAPSPESVFEGSLDTEWSEAVSENDSGSEKDILFPTEEESPERNTLAASGGDDDLLSGSDDFIVESEGIELPIITARNSEEITVAQPSSSSIPPTFDQKIATQSERINELERQLLEQIGRAVSQGLLEPDVTETEKIVEEARAYQEPDVSEVQVVENAESDAEEPPQERSHIRIQSSIDREQNNYVEQNTTDGQGTVCIDNNLVQIADWGQPIEDGLGISERRAATIGEFDLPNPEGVQRLAQYYIYLTFGAEANSVLNDFGVTVEGHDVLTAMADIMDQGYTDTPGRLAQQFGCEGAAAFWSVMAKENLNTWETYNLNSILSTFSALPLHLRRHLGPPLSERFLAINEMESAKYIQNAILRTQGDHGDAFDLLDAELELADGNVAEGLQKLENIVDENRDTAPEALVKIISTKVSEGAAIDIRLAENAEAMTVEFRGSEYENTLKNAAILARIHSGGADIALRKILALQPEQSILESQKKLLVSEAVKKLAREADETTFLKLMLANRESLLKEDLTNAARLASSERLLELGFFNQALEFMAGYSGQDADAPKMLLAKAFLGIGEAEAAARYASQVDNEVARNIAAKAHFYMNDPESAARILLEDTANPERDVFAIMAEDWESLRQSEKPEMSDFADVMKQKINSTDANEGEVPTLSTVEQLLSSSRESRSVLEALLD